jgi:MFS family permease
MAPLGGRVSDRVGVRIPATLGLMLISFAVFSFTFLKGAVKEHEIVWRQVLLGIGIGLFNPANNSAIIGSLPQEMVGLASSFLALARNLGLVIGVAFAEMIIAIRAAPIPMAGVHEGPSISGIQEVWKLALFIGLTAVLISWIRERRSEISEGNRSLKE